MTEREIFAQALEIEAAADRSAFLDQACRGDAPLRERIEALLAERENLGTYLEVPAAPIETIDRQVGVRTGTRIGPYKLLQELGQGGMGTVYLAEQQEPVKRQVALKIIKAGMDSAQVIARFEQERQALAIMDHPNIAKVLDAGTVGEKDEGRRRKDEGSTPNSAFIPHPSSFSTGRPYFVMELVKGIPITRFCDQEHLSPKERLKLFVPVCQAVQHAHQKGIIHRDLKPSNVLIALYDGRPVPKVIDFGVAKATSQKMTERTLFTEVGSIVGTLEYMAPEQAELNNLDIDTRADIYSLGVLLYELLTGAPPFSGQQLRSAGFNEMLRMIKEVEPQKPSTKLSGSVELPSIAANRRLEPKRLTKLVRGDLDWIVMKCLEKERARRYESASAFALDIQRYLDDEPVVAGPPTAAYRLRKFVRRNKGPVLAAGLVLLALVGGTIGTAIGLFRAEQARKQAVFAKEAEAEQRRIAEEERAVSREVNEFLQQDLLRQADTREQADAGFAPNPNLTVREALDRAAARIGDRFRDQPLVEAAIRQAIGEAYVSPGGGAGEIQPGVHQLERALSLRKAKLGPEHLLTLSSMKSLATAYLWASRSAEALSLLEETVKFRKAKLGLHHPDTLESMRELAVSYRGVGRVPDAIALQEETLRLAKTHLGSDHTLTLICRGELAEDYTLAARLTEAIALREETLRLNVAKRGPDHPSTLISRERLASSYTSARQYEKAIAMQTETLARMKATLPTDHLITLLCMSGLAAAHTAMENHDLAEPLLREVLEAHRRKLGPNDSRVANALAQLGQDQLLQKKYAAAEPLLRECLTIREQALPESWLTFRTKSKLGAALAGQQRFADAERLLLAGYEGMKHHETTIPESLRPTRLAEALQGLIDLYTAWDKPDEAAKWKQELEEIQRQ